MSGQFGELAFNVANGIVGFFQLMTGDEEKREQAFKKIAYNSERFGRQVFYPYIVLERALSLSTGKKRINIGRQLFDAMGLADYDPKEIERDWFKMMQYFLWGVNARRLYGDNKDTYHRTDLSRRSTGRRTGTRRDGRR